LGTGTPCSIAASNGIAVGVHEGWKSAALSGGDLFQSGAPNPPRAEQITLYYQEGLSDKVYQAAIEPRGELFVVNFAFGQAREFA
jgi:hypothetical protein